MKNLVCGRDKRGFYKPWGPSVSPQVQTQKHLTSVQATVVNPSWALLSGEFSPVKQTPYY